VTGGTAALLVGGGLVVVGGAVYIMRKKQAKAADPCAELAAIDPRAGTLCKLAGPLAEVTQEFVQGVTHNTNSWGWKIVEPISTVVNGIISAFSGSSDAGRRRNCERIRDGEWLAVDVDRDDPQTKAYCAAVGVTW